MDRISDFGSEGWGFESLRAHQNQLNYDEAVHLSEQPHLLLYVPTNFHKQLFHKT